MVTPCTPVDQSSVDGNEGAPQSVRIEDDSGHACAIALPRVAAAAVLVLRNRSRGR